MNEKQGLEGQSVYILASSLIIGFLILGLFGYFGFDGITQALKESNAIQKENLELQKEIFDLQKKYAGLLDQQTQANEGKTGQNLEQKEQVKQQIEKIDLKLQKRPIKGDPNAPITLVSYEEFQCPFCIRNYAVLKNLEKKYGVKLNFVHMNFIVHESAKLSAVAVECAGEQGKYYEMFDKIFEGGYNNTFEEPLKNIAKELGLDTKKFETCLKGTTKDATLQEQQNAGRELGVAGTPSFVIFQNKKNEKSKENLQKIAQQIISSYGTEAKVIEVENKGYGIFFVGALPQEAFEQVINGFEIS
ncbi:MAG: DsbA family protein [Candidatus Micrarchaeota archaeon]|nr:DsbA family protein [Candidatus Micrarchaeota archaeon]